MKKLLLLVLLISSWFCRAQNYQCLQSGVKHYFTNGYGYLRGIRIDATGTSGSDAIYYPFHTPRGNYKVNPNLDSTGGSWLGKKVVQHADGTYIFDDIWNDSVVIKTQAKLGDSWIFYNDTTPLYYKADLIGIDTMTILGSVDSIKKILITAHNGSGIVTTDPVDSFQIILSKNNGFVQVFDLYTFPYHKPDMACGIGIDYYLDYIAGNPYPTTINSIFSMVQLINPTFQQLYDWNVGDIFENSVYIIDYSSPKNPDYPYQYYCDTITNKTLLPGGDIQYNYSGWLSTMFRYGPLYSPAAPTTGSFLVTNTLLLDSTKMPEESSEGSIIYYFPQDSSWCLPGSVYSFYNSNISNSKYTAPFESFGPDEIYKTGLGLINYHMEMDVAPDLISDTTLLYYVKGGVSCGHYSVPFTVNSVNNLKSPPAQIQVFPNPATDELIIKTNNTLPYTITLTNVMGQPVTTIHTIKAQETISVANIPAGVYNVSITDEGGNRYNEKIVVVH